MQFWPIASTLALLLSLLLGGRAAADLADARAFLKAHCLKCHAGEKPKGEVRLDDLAEEIGQDHARWSAVREQIAEGLMPPEKEPRPDAGRSAALVAWLADQTSRSAPKLPNQGNLIAHHLLFAPPAADAPPAAAPARIWRLSPDAYKGFLADVHRGRADGIVQPFTLIPERGIKDFAGLYAIDEPSTEILLHNAETIVAGQSAHEYKEGRVQAKHDTIREFTSLMDPTMEPTPAQLEAAIQMQFRLAIGRRADEPEVRRLIGLYEKCAAGDRPAAVRTMLQAVLLKADAMYRSELGGVAGAPGEGSRRRLTQPEIARAISLSLGDRRDARLMQAAEKGELATQEQVAAEVRRMLDDPKLAKPGLLRFFRQYFEYDKATDVFKDKPTDRIKHLPQVLVSDTDRLILHILAEDKEVLRELLTTTRSFVNYNTKIDKSLPNRPEVGVPADVLPPPREKDKPEWLGTVDQVYGLAAWPKEQPAELPRETRIGILMQPSWLVAYSTNFDNDPVRRGRWIRERLLGGTVPDLPIGVAAQVPDERHRTFRDRLTVTREARCWKCHQQMDDLGLPFENFDHYGRFRTTELVLDLDATAKNVDKNAKPLGPVERAAPLDTSGLIARSGDPKLEGPVGDPREMLRKLATSDRVRQVFVRHAFRYFLGRNETLADARTLQAADRAYVENGGSFKALVVSLLASDSFLLRTPLLAPPAPQAAHVR